MIEGSSPGNGSIWKYGFTAVTSILIGLGVSNFTGQTQQRQLDVFTLEITKLQEQTVATQIALATLESQQKQMATDVAGIASKLGVTANPIPAH